MYGIERPHETVYSLKADVQRLLEKQGNALKVATHIGLTPTEASQCNARHVEIVNLVRLLESTESDRNPLPRAPRESTREACRGTEEGGTWWGLLGSFLTT
jgi:hypothetical protein